MLTQKGRVTVIGHKNPDTDSICSAIAYAELKNRQADGQTNGQARQQADGQARQQADGQTDRQARQQADGQGCEVTYMPGRAGRINEETQYVLDYFQAEAPEYIADVSTQVQDIQIRQVEGVGRNTSLKKAWERMKGASAVTLPITQGDTLEGLITLKDIVTAYMDVYDSEILSMSKTPYSNLVETLEGTLIAGDPDGIIEKGKIIVAAGSPEMIEEYMAPHDIVIVSNRYEAQLCAIEMEADCIIICNGSPVSKTIQKLAGQRRCGIISTKHDSYSTARLINQSAPVGYFMRREGIVTFRIDDFTDDVKKVMTEKRHRDFPVLDRQGRYVGMISRRFLLNMKRKQVILVDHNEKSQAVDGIDEAEILEIIDHHRLASIETMAPVFFRNQPVGCTATIVYQMYREQGVELSRQTAGLLCAAILSDTLMFRSPTCTEGDRRAADELADLAGIGAEAFAKDMFHAGSNFGDKSAEEIFYQDFKKFSIKDTRFGVGQINSMDGEELAAIKARLIPYMVGASKDRGLDMVCLMLTNILEEETELLYEGQDAKSILRRAFQQEGEGSSFRLPGVISRKKQLIPSIMAALQE